ncbi:DUF4158 domain-containing protein [Shinella curvata]|uniref:DUF4158 domain-containing protein n=1 Tax=Shinella curvata TaxID=1817964 RepID=A0ABT8XJI4_9HYPH|nr:DUF4158 domain-containing protein [Shinella curvata]MCJ8052777.1 DUF4158 domain-containing protein [Shinella curvata]MDO6123857.1 DUF4158 domain-containing protein [Shinella curvata]
MNNDIEFLENVCERMQQVGLVQSKADFSARMLGKGPSYLTSMSARDRKVPDEVMTFLAGQLHNAIFDDDVEILRLNAEAERRERCRTHRTDMLDWLKRHQTTEEKPQERLPTSTNSAPFIQRLVGWLLRGRVVTP